MGIIGVGRTAGAISSTPTKALAKIVPLTAPYAQGPMGCALNATQGSRKTTRTYAGRIAKITSSILIRVIVKTALNTALNVRDLPGSAKSALKHIS